MTFRNVLRLSIFSLLIFFSFQTNVFSHALSVSYGELTLEESQISYQFSIDDYSVTESTTIDTNQDYLLNEKEVMNGQQEVTEWLISELDFRVGGKAITPNLVDYRFEKREDKQVVTVEFVIPFDEDSEAFVLEDQLYNGPDSFYTQFLTIVNGDNISEKILNYDNRSIELNLSDLSAPSNNPTLLSSSIEFLKLGMKHIITGYDHLLFLFALLLMRNNLSGYIKIVTAFTVAHSITLTLGYLDIITLSSRLVETIIALSIVYVALENIIRKTTNWRWLITFLFGLIHGLGFASLLTEMDIPRNHLAASLLSFNLGIEIIQVAIVLLLIPILRKLQDSKYYNISVKIGSIFIALLGFIWFIDRIG